MKQILILGALLLLSSFVPPTTVPVTLTQFNINETINTLEDMKEWLEWDIQREAINSNIGKLYIINVDNCFDRLKLVKI